MSWKASVSHWLLEAFPNGLDGKELKRPAVIGPLQFLSNLNHNRWVTLSKIESTLRMT